MTQRQPNIPTKLTGDTLSAEEFNELKNCLIDNANDAESRLDVVERRGKSNNTPLQKASSQKKELPINAVHRMP